MTQQNRQQLIERHDALISEYQSENDNWRANQLLEEIAAIEVISVHSAPINKVIAEYNDQVN